MKKQALDLDIPAYFCKPFSSVFDIADYLCASDHNGRPEYVFHEEDEPYTNAYFALDVYADHVADNGEFDTYSRKQELLDYLFAVPEVTDYVARAGDITVAIAIANFAALILIDGVPPEPVR